MQPNVSVIIPIFNSEEYLRECLDSVINQTLKNIEIICVNDGSTDNSVEILKEYEYLGKRIKVLNQNNLGAGAARNNGLKIAKGEYLAFLDSDDFYDFSVLDKAYKKAINSNADIVIFNLKLLNIKNGKFSEAKWKFNKEYFPKNRPFSYKDLSSNIFKAFGHDVWNKLFKKDLIDNNNLKFQESWRANDVFFTWCSMFCASKIDIIDEQLVFQRRGLSTNLQSNNDQNPLDFYESFKRLKEFLIEKNIYEEIKYGLGNSFLSSALYTLKTLKESDKYELLYNNLKNYYFNEFYIINDNFNNKNYKEYDNILTKNCMQYILDNLNILRNDYNCLMDEYKNLKNINIRKKRKYINEILIKIKSYIKKIKIVVRSKQ
ncbi:MAG: glycosyltransferase [Treponema sp.]|nr:glycosyltransferase [Treponema sp.]